MTSIKRYGCGMTFVTAMMVLGGCASSAPLAPPPSAPAPVTAATSAWTGLQWLYGSAEAEAMLRQAYQSLTDFAIKQATTKTVRRSVVLAPAGSLAAPRFTDCTDKPSAVVFDADETLIWNLGQARWAAEHPGPFDPSVWDRWERTGIAGVRAVPGAAEAVTALRANDIRVIVNSNRDARNAAYTVAALKAAGLGNFVHGDTLYLKGDDKMGSDKDGRRTAIATKYCVIAMAGDQLGDFAQAFNRRNIASSDRRALVNGPAIRALWGNGWFLLPNPTYGPWDRAAYDDLFPAATRWAPQD